MKRDIDINEISDGKRYHASGLAKIGCNGCSGCSECCRVTDDTIHLDPYDVWQLGKALNKNFAELKSAGIIDFTVEDGLIVPYLSKNQNRACVLLSADGRCLIHDFRPGFCRLFPLGRIYNEDGSFDYFIQIYECPYPSKTKVKIKQWLGINNLSEYEKYIVSYHNFTNRLKKSIMQSDDARMHAINLEFLNSLFLQPYSNTDFFNEYYNRTEKFKAAD